MDSIPPEITEHTDQSLSTVHHALRASRRRLVIGLITHRVLSAPTNDTPEEDNPPATTAGTMTVEVRQLAKEIVGIEQNVPLTHATGDPYHSAYTALIQTHLPELDRVGAIEYNANRKEIEPDQNLLPLAVGAAITSTVAQTLFQAGIVETDKG